MPSLSLSLAYCIFGAAVAPAAGARSWDGTPPAPASEAAKHADSQRADGAAIRPAGYQAVSASQAHAVAPALHRQAATADDRHREIGPSGTARKSISPTSTASGGGLRSSGPLITTMASLAVVVGLFLLAMWLVRRHLPRGQGPLPSDVLEVLGRATIGNRQPLTLIRLGDRLLLVATNSQGVETLSEITDPDEVTRLLGICRQASPQSATAAFQQVFQQMSRPPQAAKKEDRRA
jgi:flagellar biogenesis protein FliO